MDPLRAMAVFKFGFGWPLPSATQDCKSTRQRLRRQNNENHDGWPPKASNAFCRFSTVVTMTSAWLANSGTVAYNLQSRALILACAAKRTACFFCSPACWEISVAFSCASTANLAASSATCCVCWSFSATPANPFPGVGKTRSGKS